jgi:hypothetical protein
MDKSRKIFFLTEVTTVQVNGLTTPFLFTILRVATPLILLQVLQQSCLANIHSAINIFIP